MQLPFFTLSKAAASVTEWKVATRGKFELIFDVEVRNRIIILLVISTCLFSTEYLVAPGM